MSGYIARTTADSVFDSFVWPLLDEMERADRVSFLVRLTERAQSLAAHIVQEMEECDDRS